MRKYKQILLTVLITLALVCLAWSAGIGQAKAKNVPCLVAKAAIPAGCQIQAEQLAVIMLPEEAKAECYLTDFSQVAGRWTRQALQPGEMISTSQLDNDAAGIVYPKAGPGRRLLTIRLDSSNANGFWLAAGNRIDLYLVPVNRDNGLEIQVMQGIRIMEVLGGGEESGGVVKAAADTLLCLDLNVDQALQLLNSMGLYEPQVAVINEPPP